MGTIISCTPETLEQTLADIRQRHSRLVATNGCFDILHVGHVRYLQQARAQGDALLVAVNSDASVRGLKGPSRPIVPEDERMELLAALSCVDYVIGFDTPSPLDLLLKLKPSAYVKGGEYTHKHLPEAAPLESIGTEIVFIPMVENRSTTNIVEKIQKEAQAGPGLTCPTT